MGFTGFYWVLLGFTGFYWVLLGFTGLYWVSTRLKEASRKPTKEAHEIDDEDCRLSVDERMRERERE